MRNRTIENVMLIRPSNTMPKDSILRLTTPLSLLYLGAVLRNADYNVKILDSSCAGYHNQTFEGNDVTYGLSDENVTKKIEEFKPDIVGVTSMFSSQQKKALHYCDLVKAVGDIPVVIGGLHSSLFPQETLKNNSVDFVIMGEGEYRLLNLLESLNKGKEDFEFDGIAYRKSDGNLKINPFVSRIEDLNALPLPARDLIDMERYIQVGLPIGPFTKRERAEQVMTSRGCPFSCNFCSASDYFGHKLRTRSVDSVISEIEDLINKYDIQEIQFSDDNLTANKKRAKELFTKIKSYNISWCTPNGVMVKTLDKEIIKLMADSGAYQITFAIESGSERVLREIMRKEVPSKENVKKLVDLCREYGIQTHATFIVGLPGEKKEEVYSTLQYPFDIGFNSVSFFIASPLPGSRLREECERKGYLTEDSKLNVKTAEIVIPTDSPDYVMSREDLEKLVDTKTRKFNDFSKRKNPEFWDAKFKQFLKKHKEEAGTIYGRVT